MSSALTAEANLCVALFGRRQLCGNTRRVETGLLNRRAVPRRTFTPTTLFIIRKPADWICASFAETPRLACADFPEIHRAGALVLDPAKPRVGSIGRSCVR